MQQSHNAAQHRSWRIVVLPSGRIDFPCSEDVGCGSALSPEPSRRELWRLKPPRPRAGFVFSDSFYVCSPSPWNYAAADLQCALICAWSIGRLGFLYKRLAFVYVFFSEYPPVFSYGFLLAEQIFYPHPIFSPASFIHTRLRRPIGSSPPLRTPSCLDLPGHEASTVARRS